jgi:LmbE family N-acetylglucosaminyl deacetylase
MTMSAGSIHLFLFPHQDDEFGVFHVIETLIANGDRPVCLFLTNGGYGGQDSAVRDRESTRILTRIGVRPDDLHFIGSRHAIPDGDLVGHLPSVFDRVTEVIATIGPIDAVYTPAWEGGHQDHDAANALGLVVAARCEIPATVFQFALYNSDRCLIWPYRMLSPVRENGPAKSVRIPWARRLIYLAYCLSYRSQTKTWIALIPFVAAHYFFKGRQQLQPTDAARLRERPHDSPLLYERRKKMTFEEFKMRLDPFLESHAKLFKS